MIIDLFLIGLVLIALLAIIPAVGLLIWGFVKRTRSTIVAGIYFALIPIAFFSIYNWYYYIYLPGIKEEYIKAYAGSYQLDPTGSFNKSNNTFTHDSLMLILNQDKTFKIDSTAYVNFSGTGVWNLNGPDDQLQFERTDGSILGWADIYVTDNNTKIIFVR